VKGFFDFDSLISEGAEKIDAALTDYCFLEPEHSKTDQVYISEANKVFGEFRRRVEAAESFIIGLDFVKETDDGPSYPTYLRAALDTEYGVDWWSKPASAFSPDLLSFFHDRLKVYLKDQGIRHDIIDACLAMPGNDDLTLLVKRAEALAATLKTEDGQNLIQGFKRANNILTQAEQKDGVEYSFGADPKYAEGPEELALFTALDEAEAKIGPAMQAEDFPAAMAAMAALRAPIDAFFTAVQINTDNEVLRRNRLNLLHRIRAVCSGVADLSRIEG